MSRLFSASSNHRGFTLVEVLLVIVVSGLIVSIASLVLDGGNGAKHLKRQVQSLEKTFRLAADEATYSGTHLGFSIHENPQPKQWLLSWYQWQDDRWLPFNDPGSSAFSTQSLPTHIQLALWVEGEHIALEQITSQISSNNPVQPQVIFYNSGEITAFSLTLNNPSQQLQQKHKISMDMLGRTAVEKAHHTHSVGKL